VSPRPPRLARALTALALTATAALAAGCGASGDSGASTASSGAKASKAVTLRVGVQKDGVRSILQASGQLERLPYHVSFSTFTYGPPLVEAAGADKIDVAGVGSTPPIFGAAAGRDFKIIAAIQKRSRTDDALLVPKGSTIRSLQQLEGKRIAIAQGSSANGYILRLLLRVGISPQDVQLVNLAPADALAAFSSGRVDAWAVWQPYVAQAVNDGARVLADGPPDEAGSSFEIASGKALDDPARRSALQDFVGRLQKAYAWAAKNPDEWAAAWSKESQLPESTTRPAVRAVTADVWPVDPGLIGAQQELADVLAEQKVIPGKVDFKSVVVPGLVK
jgi:sulfonate transport system substrate-binding protein